LAEIMAAPFTLTRNPYVEPTPARDVLIREAVLLFVAKREATSETAVWHLLKGFLGRHFDRQPSLREVKLEIQEYMRKGVIVQRREPTGKLSYRIA